MATALTIFKFDKTLWKQYKEDYEFLKLHTNEKFAEDVKKYLLWGAANDMAYAFVYNKRKFVVFKKPTLKFVEKY